jgi:hypothetical protein
MADPGRTADSFSPPHLARGPQVGYHRALWDPVIPRSSRRSLIVAEKKAATAAKAAKKTYRKARGGGKVSCSEASCKRPYRAKGYCFFHYAKWRRGELHPETHRYKLCSKEDCKKPRAVGSLCEQHHKEWLGRGKSEAAPAPAAAAAPAAPTTPAAPPAPAAPAAS